MARILLIETATEVCSAAIAVNGEVTAIVEESHSLHHAALLTLQVRACSERSGIPLEALDAVAVSQGPGSYTSLRVGASVAKGICFALDKPLIAINTLLSLAWASRQYIADVPNPVFIPMLDARRQEVWLAAYDADLREIVPEQPLILENDLFEKYLADYLPSLDGVVLVAGGNGSQKLENVPMPENTVFSPVKNCSARHLSELAERFFQNAEFQNTAYFEPFYMKAPNITTSSKALF